ncbi:hypothetical protein [Bradyrhizobium sp. 45]|uniref:hypothetical protein n=1 Tax=Bradyrhizobium sp. 45 TaxID=1043587 RepID=UPI001FF87758|nr:hypothetical protein [Bradyrhizobium sp. 45]MCK1304172.1 hypothetical protein [Bradyrhizobium sp. 45]
MTNLVNPLHVSRFLQTYDDAAVQKGIKLSIGFDFHKYVSITLTTPTKNPPALMFQLDRAPIKPGDGFWMMGVDRNHEVALLQAARMFDLSGSNLADHIVNVHSADPAPPSHPQDCCSCTALSAKKITGKVAYHGDIWVRGDLRGQGMPKIMAGAAFGVCFAMWAPDFICGLVERWSLDKGVVTQYGYPHYEAGGLRLAGQDVLNDYLVVWLTGDELRCRVDRHERTKVAG